MVLVVVDDAVGTVAAWVTVVVAVTEASESVRRLLISARNGFGTCVFPALAIEFNIEFGTDKGFVDSFASIADFNSATDGRFC